MTTRPILMSWPETHDDWNPPFCASDIAIDCPKCGNDYVMVRDEKNYFDGGAIEAYCCECRALLEVTVSVTIAFHSPEVVG